MAKTRSVLAAELRAGNSTVLADFLVEVRRPLMAFIEKRLGDALRKKIEPDDIFQEVSVDAVRSFDAVEFGDRDPFSWLCQIAERRIIDANRHFSAKKRAADKERPLQSGSDFGGLINAISASVTTPSAAFSRNVRENRLHEAIEQLPEVQREAIFLKYVENMPSKEIAEKIGKSDAAVRVMLTRSLKKLADIMG